MTHEKRKRTLTALQKRFVKEYVLDFNGTEAYLRSTDKLDGNIKEQRKSAGARAAYLMNQPKIKEAIDLYVKETLGPKEKHLIENVDFWIAIRDNPEAKISERLKASEHLAKYQQMFVEKHQHDVTAQVQIVDDIK